MDCEVDGAGSNGNLGWFVFRPVCGQVFCPIALLPFAALFVVGCRTTSVWEVRSHLSSCWKSDRAVVIELAEVQISLRGGKILTVY